MITTISCIEQKKVCDNDAVCNMFSHAIVSNNIVLTCVVRALTEQSVSLAVCREGRDGHYGVIVVISSQSGVQCMSLRGHRQAT